MFARCIDTLYRRAKYPLKEITVRSGSSLLYEGGTVHKVTHTSVHQNYNDITHDYDIAVIKVMPPFIYGNSTKPVNLAQSDAEDIYTKWGTICGWGYYMVYNYYFITKYISNTISTIKQLPLFVICIAISVYRKN